MKCNNVQEVFESFPLLKDIADRLEKSEKFAQKEKHSRPKTPASGGEAASVDFPAEDKKGRGHASRSGYAHRGPEYFLITEYRNKKGGWIPTVYAPECGRKSFEDAIEKCLNSYDPDAIKLKVFYATKQNTAVETKVYFKEGLEGVEEPKVNANEEALKKQLADMETKVAELEGKKGTASKEDAGVLAAELKMMRKDHEHTMETMKLKDEYERKIVVLDRQIEDLQYELSVKEEEINDLVSDLNNTEAELGAVAKEHEEKEKKREQSPWVPILSDVAKQVLATDGAIDLLSGGRMSEAAKTALKKSLLGEEKIEAPNTERGASASDASGIDAEIADKHPDHQIGLKNFWAWCKGLPVADFQIVFAICMSMSKENGDLDREIAGLIAEKISEAKKAA